MLKRKSAEMKLLEATVELCRKRQKSSPEIPKGFKVERAYVVLADDNKKTALTFAFSINFAMIELITQEMTFLTQKYAKNLRGCIV